MGFILGFIEISLGYDTTCCSSSLIKLLYNMTPKNFEFYPRVLAFVNLSLKWAFLPDLKPPKGKTELNVGNNLCNSLFDHLKVLEGTTYM